MSDVDLSSWRQADAEIVPVTWPASFWFPRATRPAELESPSDLDVESIERVIDTLLKANQILSLAQLQIGYRVRDDICMFLLHASELSPHFADSSAAQVDPLDLALLMKLLPRIQGGHLAVRSVLHGLLGWCHSGKPLETSEECDELLEHWRAAGRPPSIVGAAFPWSAARLCLMLERYRNEGFTSFWA